MMSTAQIRQMSHEAAYRASQEAHEPMVLWEPEDIRQIPHIGSAPTPGWEMTRALFADATGMGSPAEPALTLGQLQKTVVPGRAYAIVQTGQFQVHIGEFIREGEEAEVDMDGKGIFPPGHFQAAQQEYARYAEARKESEGYWWAACEGTNLEPYEAMDDGMGGHVIVESVEEARENLRDWYPDEFEDLEDDAEDG